MLIRFLVPKILSKETSFLLFLYGCPPSRLLTCPKPGTYAVVGDSGRVSAFFPTIIRATRTHFQRKEVGHEISPTIQRSPCTRRAPIFVPRISKTDSDIDL